MGKKRVAMTKEAYQQYQEDKLEISKLGLADKVTLFDRIETLDLGINDWLLVRVREAQYTNRVAHSVGRVIKEAYPDWMGHVLFLDEVIGLEALHWLSRVSKEDVDVVLEAMHHHYREMRERNWER